ncbi:MAG: SDR family oxidoreductase [Bryobacteraceae bacterium]
MQLRDQVVVLTGAARGIGRAMARRFALEQPRALILADIRIAEAIEAAAETGGEPYEINIADEAEVRDLVAHVTARHGHIDLFCSNAGVLVQGGLEVPEYGWDYCLDHNFRAHLYAAQAVIPAMLNRGRGYLLQTVSAAGLLTSIGAAPYAVSKHAALALAEWIAVTHGAHGIGVSCLCPAFVHTAMVDDIEGPLGGWMKETAISPEEVAEAAVQGLAEERFLILTHPDIATHFQRKAGDYDRWIRGMQRLRTRVSGA